MIERKSYPITGLKSDDQSGTIEAIVSVFNNVDSGKEIVRQGFFTKSIEKKLPKGVWAHDWKQPIAKTIEARELPPGDPSLPESLKELGGTYIKGQFNLDTQRGKEAYSDIKFGIVDEFSIGYKVTKEGKDEKTGARELLEGEWKEWSPVLVGMNSETRLLSIKSATEIKALYEDAIAEREQSFCFLYDTLCTATWRAEMLADAGAGDLGSLLDSILAEFSARWKAAVVDQVDAGMGMMADSSPINFKGDLRERLPFAKHTEAALGAVEVFAQRSAALAEMVNELIVRRKAINELRETKAGAVYSGTNLGDMQKIHDRIGKVKKDMNAIHSDMASVISRGKKPEKADNELDGEALRAQGRSAVNRAMELLYT